MKRGGAKSADSATNVEAAAKTNLKQHYNFTLAQSCRGKQREREREFERERKAERAS